MILSKCAICGSIKSRFIKKQEAKELLSNLGIRTPLSKLDIDKLVPVPVDLWKLSDVVKNDVVKKTVYDKLVSNVNNIDSTGFVSKTTYDADKSDLVKKISDADK